MPKPKSTLTTPPPGRFVFRASAVPFGGRILRVGEDRTPYNLQSPPASALSVVGGHCDATSPGSVFRNVFCWGPSVAQTQGDQKPDGTHVTTVTSAIQNVQAVNPIPNAPASVFRADQLKLTLESTYPTQGQPYIVPTPTFGRMFLNDQEITLSTDIQDFCSMSRLQDFDDAFKSKQSVYSKYRTRFLSRTGAPPEFHQPIPRVSNGYVACSFVNAVTWRGKTTPGNTLQFTGFGTIYFGEVLMNEYSRRFTLVRLAMGSTVQADVALVDGDSNGGWIP
jgi:hypothetical protein